MGIKVLFIGNSYTYFNDMPTAYFEKLALAAGISVSVTTVTKGGWTLEKHADPSDVCGAQVEVLLRENRYDYVILQEQSYRPVVKPELFASSVRTLVEKALKNGAKPLLYATWGRAEGCLLLDELSMTNASMTESLATAYENIGRELGIPVAHVGRAFYEAKALHPNLELYNADLSHPSAAGSYLAALTLFARLFGDPGAVPFVPEGMGDAEDSALKRAAKNAVK